MSVRKIAIVGAECTGKTTLAQALGAELSALVLPERLRLWCESRGRTPQRDEQAHIVRLQQEDEARAQQEAARRGLAWVLCDSTPLVTSLYSRLHFADDTLEADALAWQQGYALTFVTGIDVDWVSDPQRDGPQARARFDALLRELLVSGRLQGCELSGPLPCRIAAAHDALRRASL